jgi:hypothetical protein
VDPVEAFPSEMLEVPRLSSEAIGRIGLFDEGDDSRTWNDLTNNP